MENSEKEMFDGNVVLVAEGSIESSDARYYHNGFTIYEVFQALNRIKDINRIKKMDLSPALAKMAYPDLEKKIAALKEEYGEEVLNVIFNGRLRVSALINSKGGIIASADHRKEIIKNIQRREGAEGSFDAYLRYASGGAAELFLDADERIIMPDSILCPTFYTEGDEEFNEERNFLLSLAITSRAPKDVKDELDNRIKEVLNDEQVGNAILFEADDMMRFGMATKLVRSISELRDEFTNRTGIRLLPDGLSGEFETKVNGFFKSRD